ncbi:hypothetical protein [Hydrogenophaga pseudoflava]|uniref:hypothetical protein n=1 Tax=Hydrogenophaga pseudoflava TaxID=47421 RepID=UPI0027E5603B|nr:hypothetical protein [Hydrogenophaga pseudoflava]MDQ7746481.1 hypothetical protein [Hydrogenophaga pseudoflava]
MATPNYGYEKRQRELAKKQKKEEKLRNKAERKSHGDGGTDEQDASQRPESGDSADSGPSSAN